MTALQQTAALSESSVQRAARDEIADQRARRPRAAETRPRSKSAKHVSVHELVMLEAHEIVERGSYSRIKIIDERTVLVV